MKRLICLVLVMLLGGSVAWAEDVFEIAADRLELQRLSDPVYVEEHLTAATQYIRIACELGDEAREVTLSITKQTDGKPVFQKNYGLKFGSFSTDEIYLKYSDSETIGYDLTLIAGEEQWRFPFYRKLMRLSHNTACSYGVRIREAAPTVTGSWPMATVVDLREGSRSVLLCASDQYIIGTLDIQVNGDKLSVQVMPEEGTDLQIHSQKVYAITDPTTLTGLSEEELAGQLAFMPGEEIEIGSPYVILYLAMDVSYDPNGLERFHYAPAQMADQLQMWRRMREQSSLDPVG